MILARVLSLVTGYLFGLIQTAYIYGRLNGIDIREHGAEMQELQMHCVS